MEFKISDIYFSTVANLIDSDFIIKSNTSYAFSFWDSKIKFSEASYDENLTYFISLNYIYIPKFDIRIHSFCSECYDGNFFLSDDSGYIIINQKGTSDYFTESGSYLDSSLVNFFNDREIEYTDVSSLLCDMIFICPDLAQLV